VTVTVIRKKNFTHLYELSLDKDQTSCDDLLDGLRLALNAYKFE